LSSRSSYFQLSLHICYWAADLHIFIFQYTSVIEQ